IAESAVLVGGEDVGIAIDRLAERARVADLVGRTDIHAHSTKRRAVGDDDVAAANEHLVGGADRPRRAPGDRPAPPWSLRIEGAYSLKPVLGAKTLLARGNVGGMLQKHVRTREVDPRPRSRCRGASLRVCFLHHLTVVPLTAADGCGALPSITAGLVDIAQGDCARPAHRKEKSLKTPSPRRGRRH